MRNSNSKRRGAILLVVLVLLALFAVIGVAFVLFAQSEATNARIQREIMGIPDEKPDPTPAANGFLQQLIYPVPYGGTYVTSALRGHELARLAYGYYPSIQQGLNVSAYNGIGAFSENVNVTATALHDGTSIGSVVVDRKTVLNHAGYSANDTIFDPEFTGSRPTLFAINNPPPAPSVFVGKNANYTYPDRNNAYLAMLDPATGQIVVPSFHRPATFGSLDPTNTNWMNAQGRYLLLRPRPFDHRFDSQDGRGLVSDFPYPPANPDGSITGDVQNYRWANNVQQNDSVWIHANLQPVMYKGRLVQPLVAALVLPLDGRVNLNVSGNRRGTGGLHNSHNGFGAYEINPAKVLIDQIRTPTNPPVNGVQDAQNVASYRYGDNTGLRQKPQSAANALTWQNQYFEPSQSLIQDYSAVNWPATAISMPPVMPNGLRTEPQFNPAEYLQNTDPNAALQHQSIYNPYFLNDQQAMWGRTLRFLDLRQTSYRFSGRTSNYAAPLYGLTAQNTSFTGASPNHPGNTARANTTLISNSLNRAGVTPNFANITVNDYMYPGPVDPLTAPAPTAVPRNFTPTLPPVIGSSDSLANFHRSLGSALAQVDLNRPLADYRADINRDLATAFQAGLAVQAHRDRHQLAADIFSRLVVATGAGQVQANGRPIIVLGSPNYNGLRYLAQLAVNIVDFIDNDDICTAFVWNPINAANPSPEQDINNFGPTELGNRVVFGVEKTRLAINEVYAEVTNDPADAQARSANQDFQVRFFIEAINPLNTGGNVNAPLGNGSAHLRIGAQSVYRVQVFDDGQNLHNQLFDPMTAATNVTGSGQSVTPRLNAQMPATLGPGTNPVEPANDGTVPQQGFRQMYPESAGSHPATDSMVFRPTQTTPTKNISIPDGGGQNRLFYTVPKRQPSQIDNLVNNTLNGGANQGKHAVLLQRLANPYQPESPQNPYITVDAMFDVLVNDAIRVGEQVAPPSPGNPGGIPGTRPNGTPDPNTNATKSHGRRAPLYGFRGTTPTESYTINQQRSFLNHNPNRLPSFEWLVHLDRKLVSPLDLISVAAVKPHELTHYFVTSRTGQTDMLVQPTQAQKHAAPFSGPTANLARALDMLTVKPWMYGVPVGGRQPGKININAIWSKDVLTALADPQAGNTFSTTEVDAIWTNLIAGGGTAARTRAFPSVSGTLEEGTANGDRPIKSFGVATFVNAIAGNSFDETLFRIDPSNSGKPAVMRSNNPSQHPAVQTDFVRKVYNNLSTTTDTYMVLFTVGFFEIRSPATSTRYMPILGREVYHEIPGDLRVQYAAIVDRSMLGISPVPLTPAQIAAGNLPQQASNLFITELAESFDPTTSGPVTIRFRCAGVGPFPNSLRMEYEGQTMTIRAPSAAAQANDVNVLVIGTGVDAIYIPIPITASLTMPSTNGIGQITFPGGLTGLALSPFTTSPAVLRKFYAGESVSSAVLGNPGPQPGFDPVAPAYKGVVRDFHRLPK